MSLSKSSKMFCPWLLNYLGLCHFFSFLHCALTTLGLLLLPRYTKVLQTQSFCFSQPHYLEYSFPGSCKAMPFSKPELTLRNLRKTALVTQSIAICPLLILIFVSSYYSLNITLKLFCLYISSLSLSIKAKISASKGQRWSIY